MAASYFSEEKLTDNDILSRFIMWQDIGGIVVFNDSLTPVSYALGENSPPLAFWTDTASNPNISEVLTYPKKSYMDRVSYGGKIYNIAVSSRAESNEMILCFDEYEDMLTDDGFNMDTLFSGFRLDMNGAMLNFASNAIKYTKKGRIDITLGCERISENTAVMKYSVKDTGQGIRSEDMDKLFTMYTQLNAVKNHGTESTGIGLAISKYFIDLMGGSVSAESVYGKGSGDTAGR